MQDDHHSSPRRLRTGFVGRRNLPESSKRPSQLGEAVSQGNSVRFAICEVTLGGYGLSTDSQICIGKHKEGLLVAPGSSEYRDGSLSQHDFDDECYAFIGYGENRHIVGGDFEGEADAIKAFGRALGFTEVTWFWE